MLYQWKSPDLRELSALVSEVFPLITLVLFNNFACFQNFYFHNWDLKVVSVLVLGTQATSELALYWLL